MTNQALMNADSLFPHLLDIVSDPAAQGLILGGGFGMRLKQQDLAAKGEQTLIAEVPPARATQDLDFFLRIDFFVQKARGRAVRDLLERLSYTEDVPDWKFEKSLASNSLGDGRLGEVKVDFLAREPSPDEPVQVKAHRVGSGADVGLHGYKTPEAFAVEDEPVVLRVVGVRSDGVSAEAAVSVPNSYAWITMKVKAVHDWLRMERGEIERRPFREKHVFDVYVLVAMLTEAELSAATVLAAKYFNHPLAAIVRSDAAVLYAAPDAPGFLQAVRQAGSPLDHDLFWTGLQSVLGMSR